METLVAQLAEWGRLICTLEFWQQLLEGFQLLGPLVPILLACVESFIPALPLVAIVTLNVMAHGPVLGFLYSWCGNVLGSALVFLFFRRLVKRPLARLIDKSPKVQKARDWVNRFDPKALFLIAMMPFTPSSFLNFAFGISDFDERRYLVTIGSAKLIMILLLALCGQSIEAAFRNPWFLLLTAALLAALYWASKKVSEKHEL